MFSLLSVGENGLGDCVWAAECLSAYLKLSQSICSLAFLEAGLVVLAGGLRIRGLSLICK